MPIEHLYIARVIDGLILVSVFGSAACAEFVLVSLPELPNQLRSGVVFCRWHPWTTARELATTNRWMFIKARYVDSLWLTRIIFSDTLQRHTYRQSNFSKS